MKQHIDTEFVALHEETNQSELIGNCQPQQIIYATVDW